MLQPGDEHKLSTHSWCPLRVGAELCLPVQPLLAVKAALGGPLQRTWHIELLPFIFCRRHLGKGWGSLCFQMRCHGAVGCGAGVGSGSTEGALALPAPLPSARAQDGGIRPVMAPSMVPHGRGQQNAVLL